MNYRTTRDVPFENDVVTNISHLFDQTRDLQSALSQLLHRIDLLDKEPTVLRKLESISDQLHDAATEIDRLPMGKPSTAGSPVPIEILRSILMHCCGKAIMSPMHAPLLLGQVCRLWRSVVWTTPAFWDRIDIRIPGLDYDPAHFDAWRLEAFLACLRGWLERSANLPLSISVVDDNPVNYYHADVHSYNAIVPEEDPRKELIKMVSDIVRGESMRWKKLRLDLAESYIKDITSLSLEKIPMLEALCLCPPNPALTCLNVHSRVQLQLENRQAMEPYREFITVASQNLRTLRLSDARVLPFPTHEPYLARWNNLTDLSLGDDNSLRYSLQKFKFGYAYNMLDHLADIGAPLRRCQLAVLPEPSYSATALRPVFLPSLHQFTIILYCVKDDQVSIDYGNRTRATWDGSLTSYFEALDLPGLYTFEYRSPGTSSFPFVSLLEKAHELTTLSLLIGSSHKNTGEPLQTELRVEKLYLSTALSTNFPRPIYGCLSNLQVLELDSNEPIGRREIYQRFIEEKQDRGSMVDPALEPVVRRVVERQRYIDLRARLDLIRELFSKSAQGGAPRNWPKVSLRLNERLRPTALRELTPFIERGLQVVIKDDYYDIPAPQPPSTRGSQWCSSGEADEEEY